MLPKMLPTLHASGNSNVTYRANIGESLAGHLR